MYASVGRRVVDPVYWEQRLGIDEVWVWVWVWEQRLGIDEVAAKSGGIGAGGGIGVT